MIDDVNRFEALQTSFQQDMREQYTLNAFDTLARYLVGIPGRKNVIWFSGSFPLDVEPNVNEAGSRTTQSCATTRKCARRTIC